MMRPAVKTRTTRETIWEAVCDLHAQEQVATREVLSELTGMHMGLVDEHVKNLINDGRLRRLRAGVFIPVETLPPARSPSITVMASGMVKLEIGDTLLELTPREVRMVGTALAGFAMQYSNIQVGHEIGMVTAEIELQQRVTRHAVATLQQRLDKFEGLEAATPTVQ
jgi:hypothetical protein